MMLQGGRQEWAAQCEPDECCASLAVTSQGGKGGGLRDPLIGRQLYSVLKSSLPLTAQSSSKLLMDSASPLSLSTEPLLFAKSTPLPPITDCLFFSLLPSLHT